MARPKSKDPFVLVTLRVRSAQRRRLEELARRKGTTVSAVAREIFDIKQHNGAGPILADHTGAVA